MENDKKIEISEKEYNQLKKDSLILSYLEGGGVDNWEYYGDSISNFYNDHPEYAN